jgi:hypothetical protein
MNRDHPSQSTTSLAAYAAAGCFIALFVLFGIAPTSPIVPILGVTAHVLLFPLVAALPAASWAKAGGYGWLVVDVASNVMGLNGVDEPTTSALRLGGHIVAALWIASVSVEAKEVARIVGLPLALLLAAYSIIAPWVPMWILYPAFLLLPVWLVLAGRALMRPISISQPQSGLVGQPL